MASKYQGNSVMSQVGADSNDDAISTRSSKFSAINPVRSSRYLQPFRSRRIKLEDLDSYTFKKKTTKERIARRLPWIGAGIGMLMLFAGAYWGYTTVPKHKFSKVVWYQDFKNNTLDLTNDFTREIALDAFGANSLDWTTASDNNSFVKDNQLYIQPTLTDPSLNVEGAYVNLTADGLCTKPYSLISCYSQRNSTSGQFINAVQSARLTTKGKHSVRYGRIEVNAKLPLGNWLWSAIWLLPEQSGIDKYGLWPASGEIDLVESRGNKPGYPGGGYDHIQSSIHMAPVGYKDDIALPNPPGAKMSNPTVPIPFSFLPKEFHTYGIDWTPQYVKVWVDEPIYSTIVWEFKTDPFSNFNLPTRDFYGNLLSSPWASSSHKSAPFDEPFYLILNVAVGGIPGYFNQRGAPWSVSADFWNAQRQVCEAREEMSDTWHTDFQPMIVDWIRMSELDDVEYWENKKSANYY